MKLINQSRDDIEIASDVRVAKSFFSRAKGLLGEREISRGSALWIQGSRFAGCNSIHTWFMRFPIDVIFVDRDLVVRSTHHGLGPWRMTAPVRGARSVFELPSGTLRDVPVEIGDQLYVGA